MNYQLLTMLVGIAIIFSGTIGNGISNLWHKKRALKVAANNTLGK
ncbi:hypothetical protein [Weissella tructae]